MLIWFWFDDRRADHSDLPEILGGAFVALAACSAVGVVLMRDWRIRRRKSRQAASRLGRYAPCCNTGGCQYHEDDHYPNAGGSEAGGSENSSANGAVASSSNGKSRIGKASRNVASPAAVGSFQAGLGGTLVPDRTRVTGSSRHRSPRWRELAAAPAAVRDRRLPRERRRA